MAKYITAGTVDTNDDGKLYYTTAILASYTPKQTDFTYTARVGDRWDLLSSRYYGSAKFWYALARANGGADGSIFITPGKQIIIPQEI